MNSFEPFGKKPASGPGNFGNFGAPANFGAPSAPNSPFTPPSVINSFGVTNGHKPAVIPPSPFNHFGAAASPKPKRNFWGDIDGDGKETAWDDMLGDGLLGDAMLAEQRARNSEPPEPDDEFLIGRRPVAHRQSASSASPAIAVLAVLLGLGFAVFVCYMSVLGG